MAYIEVPDSDLDADSPWPQSVVQQLNENIKANKASEVTGGNTHDHAGGDGNQIPTAGIADNAVKHNQLGIIFREMSYTSHGGGGIISVGELGLGETVTGSGAFSAGTDSTLDSWRDIETDNLNDYAYLSDTNNTQSGFNHILKTKIRTGVDTSADIINMRLFVGASSSSITIRADSTPDVHGALFRYATDVDGTAFWRCITIAGTGASAEETTTTATFTASTEYELEIRFGATEIVFLIDGTIVATNNTIVPTSTTALGAYCGVTSLSGTGNSRGIGFNRMELIKEA